MANDPQELTFGQVVQTDPEFARIRQRRLLARAMQEAILKQSHGDVRRSPFAWIADYMTARTSRDKADQLGRDEEALFARHQAAERSGMEELQAALSSPDAKIRQAALLKAMGSQYPGLSKTAGTLHKGSQDQFEKLAGHFKEVVDPQSVFRAAPNMDLGAIQNAPPMAPPNLMSGVDPGGTRRNWLQTQNRKGEYSVHPLTDPATTTISLGEKPGFNVLEQQGKHYAAGGKGFEEAQGLQAKLTQNADLLRTLNQNPQMGAGASAFQVARKWAETLGGAPLELSGNTEQMKMQLSQYVLTQLGGKLGNQISDQDRKFMVEAIGELDTNPGALRRLLLMGLKASMKSITIMKDEAERLERHPTFAQTGVKLPGYSFSTPLPELDANDLELVFGNNLPPLRGTKPELPPGVKPVRR